MEMATFGYPLREIVGGYFSIKIFIPDNEERESFGVYEERYRESLGVVQFGIIVGTICSFCYVLYQFPSYYR